MDISIRPAKPENFALVAELTNHSYTVPYAPSGRITRANDSLDNIKNEIKEGAKIFVAEVAEKIIGTARYKPRGNDLLLYKLAVDPERRRQGVGSKLVKYILQEMKTTGADQVMIEVAEEKGLTLYYESLGFKITKRYLHKGRYEVQMSQTITALPA